MHHLRHAMWIVLLIGLTATSGEATTESSCPAPCKKLPSANIFVREPAGTLDIAGNIAPLSGQVARGKKHTVLRVDVTLQLTTNNGVTGIYQAVSVNGVNLGGIGGTEATQACPAANATCALTVTYWLALDAAEADHPGVFIKHPLVVTFSGGSFNVAGAGNAYHATLAAQLLKSN